VKPGERRNRVELAGTVASAPKRRTTPAGTPVAFFRLRVEPDPDDPAVGALEGSITLLGVAAADPGLREGVPALVRGAVVERRWRGPGGTANRRFEILAREIELG
jgi:hypothetical protein